jgi:hypothetical protein
MMLEELVILSPSSHFKQTQVISSRAGWMYPWERDGASLLQLSATGLSLYGFPDKAASHTALLPSLVAVHSPCILVILEIWQ